jgi:hypothetical protein
MEVANSRTYDRGVRCVAVATKSFCQKIAKKVSKEMTFLKASKA